MAVYIDIADSVYEWALNQTKYDGNPNAINQLLLWKNGTKKPTINQLEKISNTLGLPFGYFFLDEPPKEENPLIEFRTIDCIELDVPSRNLINTIHEMQNIQAWVAEYHITEEIGKNNLVGIIKPQGNYLSLTEHIRKELELPIDWYKSSKAADDSFRFFKQLLSSFGIIVMMNGIVDNNTRKKLNINEFRAFALINDYAPLIFINSNDSANAKLFSLLHEFVHICLGENSLYNDNNVFSQSKRKTETICNAIAAEILVPQEIFTKVWNDNNKDIKEKVIELTKYFKCSSVVIARKALDNGFISNSQYEELASIAKNNYIKKKTNGHPNYYTNTLSKIDNRFLLLLNSSIAEGKTTFTEAYRLTNTNRNTFDKLITKLEERL